MAVGPPIPSAADCCMTVSAASSSQGQRRKDRRSCVRVNSHDNHMGTTCMLVSRPIKRKKKGLYDPMLHYENRRL